MSCFFFHFFFCIVLRYLASLTKTNLLGFRFKVGTKSLIVCIYMKFSNHEEATTLFHSQDDLSQVYSCKSSFSSVMPF